MCSWIYFCFILRRAQATRLTLSILFSEIRIGGYNNVTLYADVLPDWNELTVSDNFLIALVAGGDVGALTPILFTGCSIPGIFHSGKHIFTSFFSLRVSSTYGLTVVAHKYTFFYCNLT